MKTLLFTLSLAITSFFLTAQNETQTTFEGTSITITVPIKSTKGSVEIALYDETSFMKSPLVGLTGEIKDGKATVTFTNIEAGTYAVILYHDKNSNKMMDFEPNGMPKEMYGVSNNIMSFGPPVWNDAKFELADSNIDLEIRL